MKVLYITNARIPTEKAHGWQIVKMCQAFAKAGVDVELLVPRRRNVIKEDAFDYYGINKNFNIHYLPCLDLVKYGRLGFFIQVATFTLSAAVRMFFKKADAIYYTRDEVFSWVMSIFRNNVYYEMHDYPRSHRWLYAGLFRRVAKIISTNQIKKNRLIKEFKVDEKKVVVQRNGVDVESFRPFESKQESKRKGTIAYEITQYNKKYISYIGKYKTFGQSKGVEELIEAFAQLRQQRDDIFLMLVGINFDEKEEVKEIFKKNNLEWNIDYRIQEHNVPHGLMFEYFHSSDVLIMNYPNTEHYAQFMSPLKMFEYMASGTPIVSTDLPSVREVLNENNSVLVEPGNTEALAQGINKVLRDEPFAKRIAEQAQEDVKKYDWNKRAQSLLAVMRQL